MFIRSKSTNISSGASIYSSSLAISSIFSIDLPDTATFLPYFLARFTSPCTLFTFDANVATIILFLQFSNILSKTLPTEASDIVNPFLSAFVLSDNNASTPSLPSSPSLDKFICLPSTGVYSILKSPVCIIVPTSVFIASIAESGILCADAINSTENLPSLIISPNSTTFSSAFASKLCSLSLEFISPIVKAVEYIGTFTFLSKYGIEPI